MKSTVSWSAIGHCPMEQLCERHTIYRVEWFTQNVQALFHGSFLSSRRRTFYIFKLFKQSGSVNVLSSWLKINGGHITVRRLCDFKCHNVFSSCFLAVWKAYTDNYTDLDTIYIQLERANRPVTKTTLELFFNQKLSTSIFACRNSVNASELGSKLEKLVILQLLGSLLLICIYFGYSCTEWSVQRELFGVKQMSKSNQFPSKTLDHKSYSMILQMNKQCLHQ